MFAKRRLSLVGFLVSDEKHDSGYQLLEQLKDSEQPRGETVGTHDVIIVRKKGTLKSLISLDVKRHASGELVIRLFGLDDGEFEVDTWSETCFVELPK